jgi:hypothetical protein
LEDKVSATPAALRLIVRSRRVVPFPDNRDLVGARGKMPVDAIHRYVGGTVFEPFDGNFAGSRSLRAAVSTRNARLI